MVLDVTNTSTQNGALVQQWTWVGGANQQWQFIPLGNGYNEILNINSGKVLDVYGGSVNGGAAIQQWDWLGGGNQQWQVVPVGNGYNAIFNLQSGMVLDVTNVSTNGGALIQQWTWLGGANQQWQLIPVNNTNGGYAPAPPIPVPSTYAFTASSSGIIFAPRSNNTVYFICYDGSGHPLAGCGVTLSTGWYPQTNAHLHTSGGSAFSTLSPSSGYTDQNGYLPFTLTPGYIGQVEAVIANSDVYLENDGFDFAVGYSDLVYGDIPALWTRIGGSDTGPNVNHGTTSNNRFMTMSAYSGLYQATVDYLNNHPAQTKVCVNDAALPMGGKFDINATWQLAGQGHKEHDRGSAVDIATNAGQCQSGQTVDGNSFVTACLAHGAFRAAFEGTPPHAHCNWQNPATYAHIN